MKRWTLPLVAALCLGSASAWAADKNDKTVCVSVLLRDASDRPPLPAQAQAQAQGAQPAQAQPAQVQPDEDDGDLSGLTEEQRRLRLLRRAAMQRPPTPASLPPPPVMPDVQNVPPGQNPLVYLRRLLEHFVTHERGFTAVADGCAERLNVELYPLREGWTAFVRYTGHGREERVDQLYPDELSQFAERAVLAVLYDQPISRTILRDTVLRSDSKRAVQRIRGTNHFQFGLGTRLRGGDFPTAQDDGSAGSAIRVFSPMTLGLGYRGKFESWGIDTFFDLGIGTSKTGLSQNSKGGHIDYGGDISLALHFLRYLNPRGLTTFYVGAGSSFEMLWLYQIRAAERRTGTDRDTVLSGGLDVDLLCGFEFMRASRAQFFLQAALQLPAYVIDNSDNSAAIKTWAPGMSLKLGMML